MADVAVGDIIEVTFEGLLHGQQILTKWHYRCGSIVGGVLTQEDMATELHTKMHGATGLKTAYQLCLPSQWSGVFDWYQVIKPTRYVAFKIGTSGDAGTSTFDANTANVAFCLTSRGELAGRKYVKTSHIPMPEDSGFAVNGYVNALGLTALGNLGLKVRTTLQLINGGRTAEMVPIIFHRNGLAGQNYTYIVDTIPQPTIRVMRRRTVGIGK